MTLRGLSPSYASQILSASTLTSSSQCGEGKELVTDYKTRRSVLGVPEDAMVPSSPITTFFLRLFS
jgi:hypothetical protein